MNLAPIDTVERGLHHYTDRVARALGLANHGTYISLEPPLNAYIALDRRLATHPDRDVALLWDERHGWSIAVETHGGADLLVLGYLGGEILPAPDVVAGLVRRGLAGDRADTSTTPPTRPAADLRARLAEYVDLEAPLQL
jgi:Family of unknown function (DUF6292)